MPGNSPPQTGQVLSLFMNGTETLPFRAGEIVTAEVLNLNADNSATITVRNLMLEVHAETELRKGETLTLRIEKPESAIYLRLAGNAAEQAGSVKSDSLSALAEFEKLKPVTEGMAQLVNLLSKLPEPLKANLPEIDIISRFLLPIEHLSAITMKNTIQNGGVLFETKLRILALGLEADGPTADIEAGRIIANDLKASLLRLKETFLTPAFLENSRSSVSPDELLDALNTVLRNIEFCQLKSQLSDSLQLFLPLVWKQLKDGEIIVWEYDRGYPGELFYACTVNLDLERAGRVRVNVAYQSGQIQVTCAAENSGLSQLLQSESDSLVRQLSASGLRLGRLTILHEPKDRFSAEPCRGRIGHPGVR